MESVYDIINELGVSADYLYKQHTGHRIFNDGSDESSENSDGSDDSDSENKPPLFTYEEIMANLGDYNPVLLDDSAWETPETIAGKLRQYITEYQCFICNVYGKKHYTQPGHFKGVRDWIEEQLKKVKHPVDWELIFCQVCNQPLSGNEQGRAHYSKFLHKEKANSFCTACLRVIDSYNMDSHCKSKQHIQNEAMIKAAIKSEEEPNRYYREDTVFRTKSQGPSVQTTFPQNNLLGERTYASVLTHTVPKPPKPDNTLFVRTQAEAISSKVGPSAKRTRSRKKKNKVGITNPQSTEQSVVESYVQPKLTNMPYNNCDQLSTRDISDVLFYGDRQMFQDQHHKESFRKAIGGNDTKIQYNIESSNYYEVLMDTTNTSPEIDTHSSLNRSVESIEVELLVGEAANNNEEAIVDGVKKRRKRRKRKGSRYSDISSVTDEVSETVYSKARVSSSGGRETFCESPGDEHERIKQTSITSKEPHAIMFRVLFWMMRWNYCNICNEPVRRQEKGNHYKQKAHIRNFVQFMETEALHYGFSAENIGAVYCLFCHALFLTAEQAYSHYESEKHARIFNNFCPICFAHGHCKEHKEFKQKMSSIFDQFITDQISLGDNAIAEFLQIPKKAADKNDKDSSQKKIPSEDSKIETLMESLPELKKLSQITLVEKTIMPESATTKAVMTTFEKNRMYANERSADRLQQSSESEKQMSYKASGELAKFNMKLTQTNENKQRDLAVQPKKKPIISDKTKCLNEISNLNAILTQFLKSDSSLMQIPALIMYVRNLKQSAEVMLQTGIDIPCKQVFNFSRMNFPDRVESSNSLNILKKMLLGEVLRLINFIENQPKFKSDKVAKLFLNFNLTILANLRDQRKNNQFFEKNVYGKDAVNSIDDKNASCDNKPFVDSDDISYGEHALNPIGDRCAAVKPIDDKRASPDNISFVHSDDIFDGKDAVTSIDNKRASRDNISFVDDDIFYGKVAVNSIDNKRASLDGILCVDSGGIFHIKDPGNCIDSKHASRDTISLVDSDDDALFESAVECSCSGFCEKTK